LKIFQACRRSQPNQFHQHLLDFGVRTARLGPAVSFNCRTGEAMQIHRWVGARAAEACA
jgi:hypothetical protein